MATQGLITVKSGDTVLMKVVVGCDGYNAQKVADGLKTAWPVSEEQAHQIAEEMNFGCIRCLVVMTEAKTIFNGDEKLHSRYQEKFPVPDFNPRWKRGSADHVVIVEV